MARIFKWFFIIAAVTAICSCNSNSNLENALELAGHNRPELESVLEHYSRNEKDSMKLRAAKFLIENMPGHHTVTGYELELYRRIIDSDTTGSYFSRKVLDIILPFFKTEPPPRKKEDLHTISADFLINHIDNAFDQYETYPWLEKFPFDMFLEYLVPYRIMEERLDYWRDSLILDDKVLEEISHIDNIKYMPSEIYWEIDSRIIRNISNFDFQDEIFGSSISLDCYGFAIQELFRYRAVGIPCTVDFIPAYGNRNGYHYWTTFITPEIRIPNIRYAIERKAPKIYRYTYARQNDRTKNTSEYIPSLFRTPFIRDVTDLYANTRDILIKNFNPLESSLNFAYLCVFNNLDWQPIAITKYEHDRIYFEKMGENMVYLPIVYNGENMTPINFPFILYRNGEIHYLIPNTSQRQNIVLTRKYPNTSTVNEYLAAVNGSSWVASNTSDFKNVDTIFKYQVNQNRIDVSVLSDNIRLYRYWKYIPKLNHSISEFYFLGENNHVIDDVQPQEGYQQALLDNDPLTCTLTQGEMTFDLGKETPINKIVCIPRTDGNGIVPGNAYELQYFDLDGWKSLGQQIAQDDYLEYDNVPSGALLWLKNHTTGVEERIFTYENGKIRFW